MLVSFLFGLSRSCLAEVKVFLTDRFGCFVLPCPFVRKVFKILPLQLLILRMEKNKIIAAHLDKIDNILQDTNGITMTVVIGKAIGKYTRYTTSDTQISGSRLGCTTRFHPSIQSSAVNTQRYLNVLKLNILFS